MQIRTFEAFAGYGSQLMALKRVAEQNSELEIIPVGYSEIDKYAIMAYKACHGDIPNFGDICKIDWDSVPDFDLFTYSFPCTDVSSAGRQTGFSEGSGTRSALLWECRKAILAKRPKYLLMENVKALVSQKFIRDFRKWEQWLAGEGYNNFCKVLNAKDYGVPQNRERIFMVSCLDDTNFKFPDTIPLTTHLEDLLERNVSDEYYLTEKTIEGFAMHNRRHEEKGTGFM